ncbi:MAG: chlorophyll a/b-binding protein [Prochlorococcaceae cyanobacterium ETNP1_MAG_9]|jgi:hypothetical protein|nr:chlorophyll a/b-binding protein [Prochlorococcaceae cyanobacterium ETNP1_MAG_9]
MTSNNPEISGKEDLSKAANKSDSSELPQSDPPSRSATTKDNPSFGWSGYAERVNGRFAMVGFIAILLIEALSKSSFLHWAGFLR